MVLGLTEVFDAASIEAAPARIWAGWAGCDVPPQFVAGLPQIFSSFPSLRQAKIA